MTHSERVWAAPPTITRPRSDIFHGEKARILASCVFSVIAAAVAAAVVIGWLVGWVTG